MGKTRGGKIWISAFPANMTRVWHRFPLPVLFWNCLPTPIFSVEFLLSIKNYSSKNLIFFHYLKSCRDVHFFQVSDSFRQSCSISWVLGDGDLWSKWKDNIHQKVWLSYQMSYVYDEYFFPAHTRDVEGLPIQSQKWSLINEVDAFLHRWQMLA